MNAAALLVALAAAAVAPPPPASAPESPRCQRALEALRVQEAALPASAAAGSASARAKLVALRRQAARECLGGPGAVPPPRTNGAPGVSTKTE